MAPVLLACWALGRLLGPQLMVAGGGHPTHQWFGMYYADQAGRRLPVPIFQALEDFTVYLILIAIERRLDRWPDGTRRAGYPAGTVIGTAMVLWGIERSLDEHLWLGEDGRLGSDLVQLAGVLLVVGGAVILFARASALEAVAPHAPTRRRRPGANTAGERGTTGLTARHRGAGPAPCAVTAERVRPPGRVDPAGRGGLPSACTTAATILRHPPSGTLRIRV